MRRSVIALCAVAVTSCARPAPVEVRDVWARETVGGSDTAAVFMTISAPAADRLVAASTPVAKKTDLMTMRGGSDAMQMTYVQGIDIPAGKPVSLNAGGLHVWLAGLNRPLKAGENFPLTLTFAKSGDRQLAVTVVKAAAAPPDSAMRM